MKNLTAGQREELQSLAEGVTTKEAADRLADDGRVWTQDKLRSNEICDQRAGRQGVVSASKMSSFPTFARCDAVESAT